MVFFSSAGLLVRYGVFLHYFALLLTNRMQIEGHRDKRNVDVLYEKTREKGVSVTNFSPGRCHYPPV